MAAFGWNLVHGGKTPPPGEVVRPGERLSWPRTVGLGAQHVVAMYARSGDIAVPRRRGPAS